MTEVTTLCVSRWWGGATAGPGLPADRWAARAGAGVGRPEWLDNVSDPGMGSGHPIWLCRLDCCVRYWTATTGLHLIALSRSLDYPLQDMRPKVKPFQPTDSGEKNH